MTVTRCREFSLQHRRITNILTSKKFVVDILSSIISVQCVGIFIVFSVCCHQTSNENHIYLWDNHQVAIVSSTGLLGIYIDIHDDIKCINKFQELLTLAVVLANLDQILQTQNPEDCEKDYHCTCFIANGCEDNSLNKEMELVAICSPDAVHSLLEVAAFRMKDTIKTCIARSSS